MIEVANANSDGKLITEGWLPQWMQWTGDSKSESTPESTPESTQPPIRLRMISEGDQVAMQVEWCEQSDEKQRWSSDEDNFCTPWEATKLLPSCATNISIHFHTKRKQGEDDKEGEDNDEVRVPVTWANRSDGATGKERFDSIELRMNPTRFQKVDRGIDAVFRVSGYGPDCFLKSAWNKGEPRSWELRDEESSRPEPADTLPVLAAADSTPFPPPELGNKVSAYVYATNRFVTGLRALQQVRRDGIQELSEIDEGFTLQWWGVNVGNSASFACDTVSAITVIPCPPVSILTGFCSAVITVSGWTFDTLGEASKNRRLRRLLYWMLWNCLAVQELEKKWQAARMAVEADKLLSKDLSDGLLGDHFEIIRTIAGNSFCITFDTVSSGCSCFKSCPVKVPFYLTWFGALGCFMVAANGWFTTKTIQTTVREMGEKLEEATKIADKWIEEFMQQTEVTQRRMILS